MDLTLRDAEHFANLALACIHRQYPNKIAHVLLSESDAKTPQQLTPAFYGCFDWHSAVHGHWLLTRLIRLFPDASFNTLAREAVGKNLTPSTIFVEVEYLKSREGFERPYGLAWLLQLCAELREWEDPQGKEWLRALAPLEQVAVGHLKSWLPKLTHPIRCGEHAQTAFALGLILDWARTAADIPMKELLISRIHDFYFADRNGPLAYEPSGHDFLSPCLAEADLMRRILMPDDFATWLSWFLPDLESETPAQILTPLTVSDPSDGKLAHLDGLNLSRAWMLRGMAYGLPRNDRRTGLLEALASAHRDAGLRSVTGEHYEGGHWLATFAVYLVTRRGIAGAA